MYQFTITLPTGEREYLFVETQREAWDLSHAFSRLVRNGVFLAVESKLVERDLSACSLKV